MDSVQEISLSKQLKQSQIISTVNILSVLKLFYVEGQHMKMVYLGQ